MKGGYSICFNEWALDKSIKDELGLLLIISSLTAEKGYCYANNDYLAKIFETNVFTISRKIKKLEEKKYIKTEYEKKGCLVISRKIRLTKMSTAIDENVNRTIDENVKENNINNLNNTIINNINSPVSSKQDEIPYKDIVEYLNLKAKTRYKISSKKTRDLIRARISEGFTIEDFKKVIDNKCEEWLNNNKMKVYLRPETLFGNKFESYLNQDIPSKKDTGESILRNFDHNNKISNLTEEEQQELDDLLSDF